MGVGAVRTVSARPGEVGDGGGLASEAGWGLLTGGAVAIRGVGFEVGVGATTAAEVLRGAGDGVATAAGTAVGPCGPGSGAGVASDLQPTRAEVKSRTRPASNSDFIMTDKPLVATRVRTAKPSRKALPGQSCLVLEQPQVTGFSACCAVHYPVAHLIERPVSQNNTHPRGKWFHSGEPMPGLSRSTDKGSMSKLPVSLPAVGIRDVPVAKTRGLDCHRQSERKTRHPARAFRLWPTSNRLSRESGNPVSVW